MEAGSPEVAEVPVFHGTGPVGLAVPLVVHVVVRIQIHQVAVAELGVTLPVEQQVHPPAAPACLSQPLAQVLLGPTQLRVDPVHTVHPFIGARGGPEHIGDHGAVAEGGLVQYEQLIQLQRPLAGLHGTVADPQVRNPHPMGRLDVADGQAFHRCGLIGPVHIQGQGAAGARSLADFRHMDGRPGQGQPASICSMAVVFWGFFT